MRALVIDDTRISRTIVGGLLREIGFETQEAPNGKEALHLLETAGPFDLAIVDWNMPELNGLEFVRAARCNSGNSEMKIIVLTVETDLSNIVEALELGANEYAIKPISEQILREKLMAIGLEPTK
jgi:two-component system chemotaxis response regulator CheY